MDEDEREQELLRMYEGEEEEEYEESSDNLDSEEEDKIRSILQFTPGLEKENVQGISTAPAYTIEDVTDNSGTDSDSDDILSNINLHQPKKTKRCITIHSPNEDDTATIPHEYSVIGVDPVVLSTVRKRISERRSRPRYNDSRRLCHSCKLPGHESRYCPTCADCGMPKDPNSKCNCINTCQHCKERGHLASQCTNKKYKGSCDRCGSTAHVTTQCHTVWHEYVDEKPPTKSVTAYCYYCGESGHYGDDCPRLPPFMRTTWSVFRNTKPLKRPRREEHSSRRAESSMQGGQREYRPQHNSPSRYSNHSDNHSLKIHNNHYNNNYNNQNNRNTNAASRMKRNNGTIHIGLPTRPIPNDYSLNTHQTNRTGDNNWRAINMPQPTRSGTVHIDTRINFPRSVPTPSSSGYIDLTNDDDDYNPPRRGPKYHGGYRKQ